MNKVRVISQEKGLYRVMTDKGEMFAEVSGKFRYEAGTALSFPAVGDYVMADTDTDGNAIIHEALKRSSVFVRKAAGTARTEQVVAANVDIVFLCMSLNNDFNVRRLERYIGAAWESGAMPVVVLTKADLCNDIESKRMQVEEVAMGVDILVVTSIETDGYNQILSYIKPGKTIALLGSSGVGKSTLINRLLGEDKILTNGLRNDDKGRHTTTHRELIYLDNGAMVIDTPGMRELGMWDADEGIDKTFSDIVELSLQCRFSDCTHTSEPGCAVKLAIDDGVISLERFNSYLKLKNENLYQEDSENYLKAKEEKFKDISKQIKMINKNSIKK